MNKSKPGATPQLKKKADSKAADALPPIGDQKTSSRNKSGGGFE